MNLKKVVSVLVLGGSMALLSQSVFATNSPAVYIGKEQKVQTNEVVTPSRTFALGTIFLDVFLQPGARVSSWDNGQIYNSTYPHTVTWRIEQRKANQGDPDPDVTYRLKATNGEPNIRIDLVGKDKRFLQVQLGVGQYYIEARNWGNSVADVYSTLGNP
ncbi:hypothetical protein YDYSG_67040 [Paenibacillus tyrfis]|uniref:hypothetical protein n=1 Tax=Paenibacillus TaxID=44249 RepID=UPI002491DCEB|nr:hypothetical protein [Paenibacillus tyrfis]GLI10668.1 hypothetical protein YDYSG_67040 [Paenibacillus tyrfis]GMX66582.1 hypothetical protein Elgi_58540 [Paenibacillus elgii]